MIFGEHKPTSVGDRWNTIELGLGWPKPTFALCLHPNLSRYFNDGGMSWELLPALGATIEGFTYVINIYSARKEKEKKKVRSKPGRSGVLLSAIQVLPTADPTRKRYFVIASFANLLLRGKLYAIVVKVRLVRNTSASSNEMPDFSRRNGSISNAHWYARDR